MFGDTFEDEDEYYSHQKGSTPWHYIIPLALAFFFIFIFYRNETFTGNAAFVYSAGVVLAFLFFRSTETEMKLRTPKVIANGDFTTYNGNIEYAGEYAILRREGIDSSGFKMGGGGRHGVIIVPDACINNFGPSIAIAAQLFDVPFEALPEAVQMKLPNIGVRRDAPILHGIAAPELYSHTLADDRKDIMEKLGINEEDLKSAGLGGVHKPSISFLVSTIFDLRKRNSELKGLVDARIQDLVGVVDGLANITERSKAAKAFDWLTKDEERK